MSNNTLDVLLFVSDVALLFINTQFKPFSLLECHARHFLSFHISNYFYLTFMWIRKNPNICIRLNLFAFVENTKQPCLPHEARLISIIIPSQAITFRKLKETCIHKCSCSNSLLIQLGDHQVKANAMWVWGWLTINAENLFLFKPLLTIWLFDWSVLFSVS